MITQAKLDGQINKTSLPHCNGTQSGNGLLQTSKDYQMKTLRNRI